MNGLIALQWSLFLALGVGGLTLWLGLQAPRRRLWAALAGGVAVAATIGAAAAWDRGGRGAQASVAAARAELPSEGRPGGYVRSDACRACHPAQYATWHRSFHRTMTQYATPEAVKADFSQRPRFPVQGGTIQLERRDDAFWMVARADDPKADEQQLRIGLVTGSHHMQMFWSREGPGNQLGMIPYAYLLEDRRWVPALDTFLIDPRFALYPPGTWNVKCVSCHVTAGQPRVRANSPGADSRAAEIGIGCESCHGPGGEHVRLNRNPARRYALALAGRGDPSIVNPKRLAPRASSEVCGQCHSVNAMVDWDSYLSEGVTFTPGQPLDAHRPSLVPGHPGTEAHLKARLAEDPHFTEAHFWPDGVTRVIGREWSSVQRSKCHLKGGMTCLSCHSMHDSDPSDQLARGAEGDSDEPCLKCHERLRGAVQTAAHTHHAADSSGSRCYNCHMPYTTYGLLKATRSHYIESPAAAATLATGRPNACTLCHLDQPLGWAAEHLSRWYGHRPASLPDDERTTASSVIFGLRGDAAQRVLVAWAMGWPAAQKTSGTDWMPRHLSLALGDPYSAIRYVAARSLRSLPGFESVTFDYVAPLAEIRTSMNAIVARWNEVRRPLRDPALAARVLMKDDGTLDTARMAEQLARRDNRLVNIAE